jgi:hypothetical protein
MFLKIYDFLIHKNQLFWDFKQQHNMPISSVFEIYRQNNQDFPFQLTIKFKF